MAAIYLPENKLHPFVTQTQNEMHLKGKGSATGTMEIVLGKEKQDHLGMNVAPDQTIRSTEAQKPKTFRIATFYAQKLSGRSARNRSFASHDIVKECVMNVHAPLPHPLNRKSANFTQQGISKRAPLS